MALPPPPSSSRQRPVAQRLLDPAGRALILAALLLALAPRSLRAAERCPGSETTLALRECLGQLLEQSDRAVAAALAGVAAEAARVPEASFRTLWRSFVEAHAGGADPEAQLRTFQQARRQLCRYVNAISLQGSGYGLFVIGCELDFNDTLLRQLRDRP